MKLFSIYTDQTIVLKDEWFLKSLQDDWELNLVYLEDAPKGKGDYLSNEWYHCIKTKIDILIEAIQDNRDDIILWADIDMQFFRKCNGIIEKSIQGKDIVFQKWNMGKTEVNPGFMAIRCNENSLAFFEAVRKVPFDGKKFADQDVINDILTQGTRPLQWDFFPQTIYQVLMGPVPFNIALHHACATREPFIKNGRKVGSIELKIKQMTAIRRFADSSFLKKLYIRHEKPIKPIVNRVMKRIKSR